MKQDALQIIRKSIQAVDPYAAVQSHFRLKEDDSNNHPVLEIGALHAREDQTDTPTMEYPLQEYDKLLLVAFGKASSAMATAVVQQLQPQQQSSQSTGSANASHHHDHYPNLNTMGVCICKDDHATPHEIDTLSSFGCTVLEASHPVPDQRSSKAAQQALALVQQHASPKTLVVCCISGGGSALFCAPHPSLTIQDDLKRTNQALLASGMSIQDCNVIRKRLEQGKGGRLAKACFHPN